MTDWVSGVVLILAYSEIVRTISADEEKE